MLSLGPSSPESFSRNVQFAYCLGCNNCIYSLHQAGPALGLDTWTTSKELISWILQESFSNTYKEEIQPAQSK